MHQEILSLSVSAGDHHLYEAELVIQYDGARILGGSIGPQEIPRDVVIYLVNLQFPEDPG